MAIFAPPYTYVPTAPRPKSTASRYKPVLKPSSIVNNLQQNQSSDAALDSPQLPTPDIRDCRSALQGMFQDGIFSAVATMANR